MAKLNTWERVSMALVPLGMAGFFLWQAVGHTKSMYAVVLGLGCLALGLWLLSPQRVGTTSPSWIAMVLEHDSRKQTAIWVARAFYRLSKRMPGATNEEIIRIALDFRYLRTMNPSLHDWHTRALVLVEGGTVQDARDLCHLIAEFELLSHLTPWQRENLAAKGENVVALTYRIMDEKLAEYGL